MFRSGSVADALSPSPSYSLSPLSLIVIFPSCRPPLPEPPREAMRAHRWGANALSLGAMLLWGLAWLDLSEANQNLTRLVKPTSDYGCTYNYQRRR